MTPLLGSALKELAASNPDAASQMLQADHGASRISQGTAWSLKRGRTLKAVLAWAALQTSEMGGSVSWV